MASRTISSASSYISNRKKAVKQTIPVRNVSNISLLNIKNNRAISSIGTKNIVNTMNGTMEEIAFGKKSSTWDGKNNVANILKDMGYYNAKDNTENMSLYQNFNRSYNVFPNEEMETFYHYIFFVRPNCNLVSGLPGESDMVADNIDSYTREMFLYHNIVYRSLTTSLSTYHNFIPWLVGRTESIQIPDRTIKNYTISQPYTNYLMPYAGTSTESETGGTFDVVFREDRQLRVHRLIDLWIYYMDKVAKGIFKPSRSGSIKQKPIKFDYMSSVYHFVCRPDGETVVWFDKYTGVFPLSSPNSDLSWNLHGGNIDNKVTIPFAYFHHEANNPDILIDFNTNISIYDYGRSVPWSYTRTNSKGNFYGTKNVPQTYGGQVGVPFILMTNNGYTIKLKWQKPMYNGLLKNLYGKT